MFYEAGLRGGPAQRRQSGSFWSQNVAVLPGVWF